MKAMIGRYSDPMIEKQIVAERMVAVSYIMLVTIWVDLPTVGEEYGCNRKICYKPSPHLRSLKSSGNTARVCRTMPKLVGLKSERKT